MTYNKRKKNSRQRGSWSHGWGEKKKHRGAGSRAGRGNAGSGKRGDQKKPTFLKEGRVFGKSGFFNPATKGRMLGINVSQLDKMNLSIKKGVEVKKDLITIDLYKMGYDKLLGAGSVKGKYHITTDFASASAIEKIEAAGGKVTVTMMPPQQEE